MTTTYYVLNEHTLGYINDQSPHQFGILHGSVLKGSPYGRLDGVTVLPVIANLRPATKADFEEYRVLPPKGLFPE